MTNAAPHNPYAALSAPALTELDSRHRQQVATVGTMYAGYSTSMILRMIPTVAGSSIVADSALGIDLTAWSVIVASGTVGGMTDKFLFGWSADKFGGKRTFTGGVADCITLCESVCNVVAETDVSDQLLSDIHGSGRRLHLVDADHFLFYATRSTQQTAARCMNDADTKRIMESHSAGRYTPRGQK